MPPIGKICLRVDDALDIILKAFGPEEFELASNHIADEEAPEPRHVIVEPREDWTVCISPRNPGDAESLEEAARELGYLRG